MNIRDVSLWILMEHQQFNSLYITISLWEESIFLSFKLMSDKLDVIGLIRDEIIPRVKKATYYLSPCLQSRYIFSQGYLSRSCMVSYHQSCVI